MLGKRVGPAIEASTKSVPGLQSNFIREPGSGTANLVPKNIWCTREGYIDGGPQPVTMDGTFECSIYFDSFGLTDDGWNTLNFVRDKAARFLNLTFIPDKVLVALRPCIKGEYPMTNIAEQIVYTGRKMFERMLTDFSGGNISARVDDQIWITPRFAGSKQHWHLSTSDILHGPIYSDALLENPRFSREGKAHLAIYRTFPEAQAVIHAHPFYVLPFCVAEKPIHPPLELAEKFETIKVIPYSPAHSDALAANIVSGLQGQNHIIQKQAAGLVLPRHGIIMAGKDLYATLDAVERINWNAWCILAQDMLTGLPTPK